MPEIFDPSHDPELQAWAQRLDELDAVATAAKEADDPRAFAEALVDVAVHLIESELIDEAIDHLAAARDAFLAVPGSGDIGPIEATECAFWASHLAMQIGDYETALEGFSLAEREARARGLLDDALQCLNNRGAAATQLGEFALAEACLLDAMAGYESLGAANYTSEARLNLAHVHRLTGRQELAEQTYLEIAAAADTRETDVAVSLGSLAGLYAEQGRIPEGRLAYERTIAALPAEEFAEEVLDCKVALAHLDMLDGDPRSAANRGLRLRAAFAAADRPDKVAACDVNLANFHMMAGDYAEADAAFERARSGLINTGLQHHLPTLQWNRFKRYLLEGTDAGFDSDRLNRAALDAGMMSVIATDQQRFQFPDAHRRVRWRELLAQRMSLVFELAFTLGDSEALADLIETGINAGVYSVPETSGTDPAPFTVRSHDRPPASEQHEPDDPGGALTLGAAALLATAELPMAPPPSLWMTPPGRQVLGRYRELTARDDPAVAALLRTAPRVSIW